MQNEFGLQTYMMTNRLGPIPNDRFTISEFILFKLTLEIKTRPSEDSGCTDEILTSWLLHSPSLSSSPTQIKQR